MYEKVDFPKGEPTKEWLIKAFAPLEDYLSKHHAIKKDQIMMYMMFMSNNDGEFQYKNSITRARIVFKQSGELLWMANGALDYEFEGLRLPKRTAPVTSLKHTHPNVFRWIHENFIKIDEKYHEDVRIFLQELWGPQCNYNFTDLVVDHPLPMRKSKYCYYLYPKNFNKKIVFQFPKDEIIERSCSLKERRDYEVLELDLRIRGWQVVCYWKEHLEIDLKILIQELERLIESAERRGMHLKAKD